MIPRTTARGVLRDLSCHRASRPLLAPFPPTTLLRPFASTPASRRQVQRSPGSSMAPIPSPPPFSSSAPPSPSAQQAAAANAALSNLSHLTPAQIKALLSTTPGGVPGVPGGPQIPGGQQPPPSRRSVYLRRALWALVFFALGYKLTHDQLESMRFTKALTHAPIEVDDPAHLALWREQVTIAAFSECPMFDSMIDSINAASGTITSTPWESWEPYGDFPPERLARHLCGGTLNNPNALGLCHAVFRHKFTGELILAVVFGHSTAGWPGVVHGGMLSTIMDEAMGRLAALSFPANTAVTAKLSVGFKEPVTPGMLYIVRVNKALPEYQKEHPDEEDKSDRKMWVVGRMEDTEGATVLEAKALFVVPKGDVAQPLGRRF
ncbi:HotDog domain-containing protein [Colletotrichum cereale]|nr:HotDog domain-containing protein [Colletotrichum cereale]